MGTLHDAHILLVDDHQAVIDSLTDLLEDEGASVTQALRISEAIARANTGFDVAIVDVNLPDGSGLSILPELKQAGDGLAEILLITSSDSLETVLQAVGREIYAYMLKPFRPSAFIATTGRAVERVRLRRSALMLERRAQVAEKLAAIGTLSAGLGHELRCSLADLDEVLASLRASIRGLTVDGGLIEPVATVQSEIRRLSGLVEEFLNFARPGQLELSDVDAAALVVSVTQFLRPEAITYGIHLEEQVPSVELWICADESKLRQILLNLIRNAIEALEDTGGCIEVSLSPADADIMIRIQDDGPGISEAILPRIFEPFFSTKPMGTGLGMAICHSLIQQQGGSIGVGCQLGTTIDILLPRMN